MIGEEPVLLFFYSLRPPRLKDPGGLVENNANNLYVIFVLSDYSENSEI